MPMDGAQPNYFSINGRAYPSTDVIRMKVGETVKVRFIGSSGGFIHPMHIPRGPFPGGAPGGETPPPAAPHKAHTPNIGPGQTYHLILAALQTGKRVIPSHISPHTTHNNQAH